MIKAVFKGLFKLIRWSLIKILTGLLYILTNGSVAVVNITAKGALAVGKRTVTRKAD